jgi:hypothetical protein
MVFGTLAIAGDPTQFPAQLGRKLPGCLLRSAEQFGGVQSDLDALGQVHLLLGGE